MRADADFCLDNADGKLTDGNKVQIWDCHDTCHPDYKNQVSYKAMRETEADIRPGSSPTINRSSGLWLSHLRNARHSWNGQLQKGSRMCMDL